MSTSETTGVGSTAGLPKRLSPTRSSAVSPCTTTDWAKDPGIFREPSSPRATLALGACTGPWFTA